MVDLSRDTDRALDEGRALLRDNQTGGRHRRAGFASIGRGSAEIKQRNLMLRIKLIAGALLAIVAASMVAGLALDGIGFTGLMVAFLAVAAAVMLFSNFPKVKVPKRADLNRGDVRQLVGRTELWLEHQRAALPAPAVTLMDQIGLQLDALGAQLEGIDPAHPAAQEVRKLVGEHLPETVETYRRIPAHLRREESAGSTPDKQIVESLGRISGEIDSVTRQLAAGAIDDLAIRTRFLDYKYGESENASPEKK
ncbi:hypothetical protein H0274_14845 [Altererythrobacter sp. CC-YST694]|uniref:hypothetical protein n=1 Tax=Altererythrobacter sp. CC-YST694 TaxID=2755038 RepID=UPI001D023FF7|nr:hypothetical protein [Altererythrobacter sp. CC-YST694]MCB5426538.1 hypothetical protein [Altererythrobacter sp. CC-YST694]